MTINTHCTLIFPLRFYRPVRYESGLMPQLLTHMKIFMIENGSAFQYLFFLKIAQNPFGAFNADLVRSDRQNFPIAQPPRRFIAR